MFQVRSQSFYRTENAIYPIRSLFSFDRAEQPLNLNYGKFPFYEVSDTPCQMKTMDYKYDENHVLC